MKARPVKKLDPAGSLGENAARIVRVRLAEVIAFTPKALERDAGHGAARHANRGEAPPLRARDHGLLLRPSRRRRAPPSPRPPGHPRRDARLRRDAPARARAHRSAPGRGRRSGSRQGRPDTRPRPAPRRAGAAPHGLPRPRCPGGLPRGAPRAPLRPLRRLLARQEETGTWLRLENAVDAYLERARDARRAAKAAAKAEAEAEKAAQASLEAAERAHEAQAKKDRAAAELSGGRDDEPSEPAPPDPAAPH